MARRQKSGKRSKPKTVPRLPDLEHSKNAGQRLPLLRFEPFIRQG
jgi:hypothetical protein